MSMEHGKYVQLTPNLGRVVAPNPGPMTGAGTNTYIIAAGENSPVCIVDPGPAIDSHIKVLLDLFGERLSTILVTHTHPDHSPAAHRLVAETGAQLIGCAPAADATHQDPNFVADAGLHDNQLLELNGIRVRAIHTPGHVSNHYCFLLEQDKVLLTGDHLMNGSTVVIIPPAGVMKDYIESLQKLNSYEIEFLGPGHGELMEQPLEIVNWTIDHRLQREAKVLSCLPEAAHTALDELVTSVYDDVDTSLHPMALFSLEAHLIKLQSDGKVQEHKGKWAHI